MNTDTMDPAKDLEQSFISGLFFAANFQRDTDVIDALYETGPVEVFKYPRHQDVLQSMKDAFEDFGVAGVADPAKVFRHLRKGVFDDFEALSSFLSDFPYPASDLKSTFLEIKETHTRRQLAMIGSNLQISSTAAIPVEDIVQNTISTLLKLREVDAHSGNSTTVHYRDGLADAVRTIMEARERRLAGIPLDVARTSIPFVNDLLNGGLRPGTLTILAARPAVGKTAFGLQWLHHAIESMNDPEAWGSMVIMEMSLRECVFRDLANETEIYSSKMWNGLVSDSELEIIRAAAERLGGKRNILSHERVSTVDECISQLHGDIMRQKSKPRIIVVDYLQLLQLDSIAGVSINNSKSVGLITRKFKMFAKELEVPVVVLSQLNREVENRTGRRPQISDLRESGDIEQDADNVIFLWPKQPMTTENKEEPTRVIMFGLDKHRNGGLGEGELTYYKAKTHFEALTGGRETAAPSTKSVTQRLVDSDEDN